MKNLDITPCDLRQVVREELERRFPVVHFFELLNGEQLLSVTQTAKLLGLTTSTIYSYIRYKKIPHYHREKKVYFLANEVVDWIKEGRRKTQDELDQEAIYDLDSLYKDL